jgi:hypothetical protein
MGQSERREEVKILYPTSRYTDCAIPTPLGGKDREKEPLGRPRYRCEYIQMDVREIIL